MTLAAVGTNSQALWYLTRGFGLVALILLTVSTTLGLAQAARYVRPGLPRFVISALHSNASLLAVVAIAVHVVTAVLDTFAPIRVIDVFIPYASRYRPFWTGMGALALDLVLAVVITSLVRERIGHRVWRTVHWAAYASWPIAVMHGLGTGSDSKLGWVLLLYVACTVAVLAALWWRLAKDWNPARPVGRGTAVAASIVVPVLVAAWAVTGPLKAGWAKRAGTPPALLASGSAGAGPASSASSGSGTTVPAAPATTLAIPVSAPVTARQTETGPGQNGLVSVIISGTFQPSGGPAGAMKLVLTGQPVDGGVSLTGSQVSLGTTSDPNQFTGHVTQLEGATVVASLQDRNGRTATATFNLQISRDSGRVSGQLEVR